MIDQPPHERDSAAEASVGGRPSRNRRPSSKPAPRTAKDYWLMFRERWYFGLLAAALVVGGAAYWHHRTPAVYTAQARLIFENAPSISADRSNDRELRPVKLETYLATMGSETFRDRVAQSLTADEVSAIRAPYQVPDNEDATPTILELVTRGVTVTTDHEAPIITITATHRDPEMAALLANQFAGRYIEFDLDRSQTGANSTLRLLQDEELKQKQKMEEAQLKLQQYRERHNAVSLESDRNLVVERLKSTSAQLTEAIAQRTELETSLAQVEEARMIGRDLVGIAYIANFRGIPELLDQRSRLKVERTVLEERYLENHPRMKANTAALNTAEEMLQRNVDLAVTELRNKYQLAMQRVESLTQQEAMAEKKSLELDTISIEYETLREQAEQARAQYARILASSQEASWRTQIDNINIRFLDRASTARQTSATLEDTLIRSGAVGLALLLFVPISIGIFDVRLKAAWEVEQYLRQNLLGEIPALTGLTRKERPHIMARELDHAAAESFRGLFGQFQLNSTVPYPKIVMFTSTLPAEGKSVVVNNLASTFAAHGKRTLLIDCDLRRPNLHLYYGKDNACGLIRWLETEKPIGAAIEDDEDLGILPVKENLSLLRGGGESRKATELFGLDAFLQLLKTMRSRFDVILIDTPPLGVFPDAMLLSRLCDEVVYVCRFNAVSRTKVRKSIERLHRSEAVLTGVVLNGIPTGTQSAYYDYYGYGANESKRYKAYYAKKR